MKSGDAQCVLKWIGCPCIVFVVFLGLLGGWIEASKQERNFNEGMCRVSKSTLEVQPSACTCMCPHRVQDECEDDSDDATSGGSYGNLTNLTKTMSRLDDDGNDMHGNHMELLQLKIVKFPLMMWNELLMLQERLRFQRISVYYTLCLKNL